MIQYFQNSDRVKPREKATLSGLESLSDKELVALIIGSGTKGSGVMAVAESACSMLDTAHEKSYDLQALLQGIRGLGEVKSMQIAAALEIGRRRFAPGICPIRSPEDVWKCIRHFGDRKQEHFLVLCLNGAHELCTYEMVSKGLVNRSIVHPREVFATAIENRCSSIVIAHNHPSGNLRPSAEDKEVTEKLVEASKVLNIPILDHIIFTDVDFISLREEGFM